MSARGYVRIISGKWRGRKLKVLDIPGLRPTPDRVRETLFNWLSQHVPGAHCLDLFAGTGVLGFEALSRGAAAVTLVDQSAEAVVLMKEQGKTFDTDHVEVIQAKVPAGLPKHLSRFDIVFLDPPYQSNLLFTCCNYLEEHHLLAKTAYIYLEADRSILDNELPANWQIIKSQKAGQAAYHLALRKEVE